MPDYHDIFWRLLFQRIDCTIELFRFLLKEKAKLLELENLILIKDIYFRKKKLLYDILFEIPIRRFIRDPWDEFIVGWNQVREILNSLVESKRIDLEEEMLDYIFRSRTEDNEFLEEAIMGKKVLTAYERALEEGELKGKLEGKFETKLETARKMIERGFPVYEIQEITGLSEEQLRENGIV
jgi:hypothetical protein